MSSHMIDEATTGVVAVVRPEVTLCAAAFTQPRGLRPFGGASAGATLTALPRTQTPVFAALTEGRGLPFVSQATDLSTDRKAVITQDPYHRVSGKQLWSHPPV